MNYSPDWLIICALGLAHRFFRFAVGVWCYEHKLLIPGANTDGYLVSICSAIVIGDSQFKGQTVAATIEVCSKSGRHCRGVT